MKKILKNLKKINQLISDKRAKLREISISVYYTKVSTEFERDRDHSQITLELKDLLSQKFAILENLQIEINKEKIRISNEEREISLLNLAK